MESTQAKIRALIDEEERDGEPERCHRVGHQEQPPETPCPTCEAAAAKDRVVEAARKWVDEDSYDETGVYNETAAALAALDELEKND